MLSSALRSIILIKSTAQKTKLASRSDITFANLMHEFGIGATKRFHVEEMFDRLNEKGIKTSREQV
jgi:hypothetical protein